MATKKPAVKKGPAKAAKKPVKAVKKPVVKTKPVKPAAKKAAAKKIAVKPSVKKAVPLKKGAKKGLNKPAAKQVIDTIKFPKGGKFFVKAAKRPVVAKKITKKAK